MKNRKMRGEQGMALATSTIENGRFRTASMKEESQKLVETCEAILKLFASNPDYSKYASGTKSGARYDSKFRSLVNQIKDMNSVIQSLSSKTDNFLNKQEELNNRTV
jgi:hypothetical protein